jgi:hypothetical protein
MILTKICERQYPLWTHRRQPTADLRSDYSPQLSVISCGLPLSFCKYVLGIRKKASNLAVGLELGRLPVENFIQSQTLLYFAWLYTTKLNPLLKEFFLLCQKFRFSRHLHMVFICKEYYWWDRSWYLTAPKYY